mgnify:CR=1 FL=1
MTAGATPAAGLAVAGVTALVTGASGGIGRALAAALLARGARRVYAAARAPATPARDARVVPLVLDITDAAQVAAAAGEAADVQLLVNNAGVNRNRPLIGAPDLQAAREEMETNYFGTLAMCRAFAPVLGRHEASAIANVLSIAARMGMPAMGSLCASKAAALRLTECARAELAGQGTRVLAVLPSAVDTAMTRDLAIPKIAPAEVADALLDGVEAGLETVIVGAAAQRLDRALRGLS